MSIDRAQRSQRSLKKRVGRAVAARLETRRNARKFPPRSGQKIWIDVGAHLGEKTFDHAAADESLLVFAFEPNLHVALQAAGRLANYVVLPMAVAEQDGVAQFHILSADVASSLLPLDPVGVERWVADQRLEVARTVDVPTIRLDTFMAAAGIAHVDFLKVDAQGADLAVVRSAGDRLGGIDRIELEVQVSERSPYVGASTRQEVVDFLGSRGYVLERSATQSYGQEENLCFVRA